MADALSPELAQARQLTDASLQRAERDLAEQRRKLVDSENLRAIIRRLHQRNHISDDITTLIQGQRPRGT